MADLLEIAAASQTTDVTLTTTSETAIISLSGITIPQDAVFVMILAWAQLTTGAATTTVTPRIRRGTTTAGALVGEANAEQVKAAAGSTEPFIILVGEERTRIDRAEYVLTLQQAAATGNGTALQASIVAYVLSGRG